MTIEPEAPTTAHEDLTEVVLAVFRANGRLLEWGDRFAAPFALTSARWQVLGAIALADDALTAPQVAAAMGITRQGAQKQLNLLLADGLLVTHPNPQHRRSPQYRLSEPGAAVYAAIARDWSLASHRLAAAIPDDDLRRLRHTLDHLCELLAHQPSGETR
jgi:DNA-binding MarR family transcriptional regulator